MTLKDWSLKPSITAEESNQQDKKEKNKDQRLKIVVDELADIVLVKKNEMTEWKQR